MQNQDRGCQVSPNNSAFNVPVNSLPVDQHSTRWLTRAAEDGVQYPSPDHNLKLFPEVMNFYSNVVNNNSPQQLMNFYYGGAYQNTDFPMPLQRTAVMETGSQHRSLERL